jgi:ABC-type glycerol-3-phosphate transport system permease component
MWWVVGGGGLLLVGLWLKSFWDFRIRHVQGEEPFRLREFLQRDLVGIFFVLPAVSLLLVFMFFPMAVSFLISLTDLNIFSINEWTRMQFIGIENYGKILQDPVFWRALWNTLYFTGIGVPLTVLVSLLAAVALNQRTVKLKSLFRMSFFAPVVTTVVAVAVVWRWLYNPDYGVFNWFLQSGLGLKKLFWLSDPRTSLPSLILMAIWKNFGYNMVIFLAGLQTIPESQYEAARIDGASGWQCFRYITIPGLTPTLLFVFIMTTIGYLQFFAEPYVMTKGGPLDSTTSIVLYMYNQGFRFFNLGVRLGHQLHPFRPNFRFHLFSDETEEERFRGFRMTPKMRRLVSDTLASGGLHFLLTVTAAATLLPFFWMLSTSFKSGGGLFTYPPTWIPAEPTLQWYVQLIKEVNFLLHFRNSVLVSVCITVLSLFINSMAGYAFAKHRFRHRDKLFSFLLATMMVPGQLTMIPVFLLLKKLGLLNSYLGLIVPVSANVFGIFLIRQFMMSIPNDLIESARIDGCSEFRIYWSVVLPLCRPVLATLGIFTFMGSWNDFLWPLIVMVREEGYTLPVALANLNGQHPTDFGLLMAAAVMVVLPVIAVFIAAQKYVIQGIATTGLKE